MDMMDSKYANVDLSEYPIIVVHLNPITPTPHHIEQMFVDLEAAITSTTGPYVVISPFNGKYIPSDARVLLGEKARKMHERFQGRELGSLVVTESPVVRVMLQTINALFKTHSNNQKIVASMEKAKEAAREMLEKAEETIS